MKKAMRILSITVAIVMLLSFGVAFAEKGEKPSGPPQKEDRGAVKETVDDKWQKGLSEEDKGKFEQYRNKIGEQKQLKKTLQEKRQANRQLRNQVLNRVRACLEDENLELTGEQVKAIISIKEEFRNHLDGVKFTTKNHSDAVKRGAGALKNHDIDTMLQAADESVAHLNALITQSDETTTMLNEILNTLA